MPASQLPLATAARSAREFRSQFGALCWRLENDKLRILLVTSRDTGRWIIPKGWPISGETPTGAALTEAWEEAGVEGRAAPAAVGLYSYLKDRGPETPPLPCIVAVFAVRVKRLAEDWPEAHQRRRKWMSRRKAAAAVDEPELKALLRGFEPPG